MKANLEWSRRSLRENQIEPIVLLLSALAELCEERGTKSFEACRFAFVEEIDTKVVSCRDNIDAFEEKISNAMDNLRMADNPEILQIRLEEVNNMLTELTKL